MLLYIFYLFHSQPYIQVLCISRVWVLWEPKGQKVRQIFRETWEEWVCQSVIGMILSIMRTSNVMWKMVIKSCGYKIYILIMWEALYSVIIHQEFLHQKALHPITSLFIRRPYIQRLYIKKLYYIDYSTSLQSSRTKGPPFSSQL